MIKIRELFDHYKGFTLAEVLITLGIIGIIAALIIPPLVQNYQKTQYTAGLKKEYSQVQQVFKLYMSEQGTTEIPQTDLFTGDDVPNRTYEGSAVRQKSWDNFVKKYFKIVKSCNVGDVTCNYKIFYLKSNDDARYFGDNDATTNTNYTAFLTDGTALSFYPFSQSECRPDWSGYCGILYIDVNGTKQPNKWGRDIFAFDLSNEGNLYSWYGMQDITMGDEEFDWESDPTYWKNDSKWCGNPENSELDNNVEGLGCVARIMEQGWQMNY